MRKVLVTGATGFIGNYVVLELLKTGCAVIASSMNEAKAKLMPWYRHVEYKQLNLALVDIKKDYLEYFQNPDLLIHLAWEGLPNYKADFHLEQNMPRHFNFLSSLISRGLKDITVTGTCFEYGMIEGELVESMATHPGNSYALAKDTLRRKLESLTSKHGVIFKWVRLFYMYGKGQSPKSLFSLLDKAIDNKEPEFKMSGGEQLRDYLPVEQVAFNIVQIALQKEITGIINCSSGYPVSVKELVKNYLETRNADISLDLGYYPYPDYEPMAFWGNNNKLKSILGNE